MIHLQDNAGLRVYRRSGEKWSQISTVNYCDILPSLSRRSYNADATAVRVWVCRHGLYWAHRILIQYHLLVERMTSPSLAGPGRPAQSQFAMGVLQDMRALPYGFPKPAPVNEWTLIYTARA